MANTKNYRKQGGEEWIVGGVLDIISGGKLKLEGNELTASAATLNNLADNVTGLASFVTAGLGVAETYTYEQDGDHDLVEGGDERVFICAVICDEAIASGDADPTFQLGIEGDTDKFLETSDFAGMSAEDIILTAGVIDDSEALEVLIDDGTQGTHGEFTFLVLLLPTE